MSPQFMLDVQFECASGIIVISVLALGILRLAKVVGPRRTVTR